MSPQPIPGNNSGTVPGDQIPIPVPPRRGNPDGARRLLQAVSRSRSYSENVIRIWPGGLEQPAVDLVPCPGEEAQRPGVVFPGNEEVFVVAGVAPPGSPATRIEAGGHLLRLQQKLDELGWDWRPTVASSPDRQWVEGGALVLGVTASDVAGLAALQGQPAVLCWDETGLTPVPTAPDHEPDPTPVPVRLTPARTGCPLRGGGDDVCQVYGGDWTSASRLALSPGRSTGNCCWPRSGAASATAREAREWSG
ncbi:hypothetical protein GCM10028820_05700 [Tessaracoccus terricola]